MIRALPDDGVCVSDGVTELTGAGLRDEVERLARMLVEHGCHRLAIMADNGVGWIVADLAAQQAQLCCIPLPLFFADAQLRAVISGIQPDVILTDDPQRVQRMLGESAAHALRPAGFGLSLISIPQGASEALPRGTAKVTFTSGSTGAPKGVCLSRQNQLAVAQALRNALRFEGPRHLCLLPLSVLLENVAGVYCALLSAGCVIVPPGSATGFAGAGGCSIEAICSVLDTYRPTSIILLPQMLAGLVTAMEAGWRPPPELRFAAVGGARVPAALIAAARNLQLPVYEGYGLSETASVVSLNRPGRDLPGSAGQVLDHVVVTTEASQIIVTGNTFLGYSGEPASWYPEAVHTGDLGELDAAGFVHILGRAKNVLISSYGRNISPEWPESALLGEAAISACVVIGEQRPYCSALLWVADKATTDADLHAAVARANRDLPDYARIRSWIRLDGSYTDTPGLATANGKPRRDAIVQHYADAIDTIYDDARRASTV
ncbi:MAG: AMP-binding protein [Gammaproteobacteria bacterium]|jgi:long-subunit acyl-CoA synthetase (AMP-forming)|nr:AMP-binding protein [Gammaproteobacteria bacterium]